MGKEITGYFILDTGSHLFLQVSADKVPYLDNDIMEARMFATREEAERMISTFNEYYPRTDANLVIKWLKATVDITVQGIYDNEPKEEVN